MTITIRQSDVDWFRAIVGRRLGLSLAGDTTEFLTGVLGRRVEAVGDDCESYLGRLDRGGLRREFGPLGSELANNETSFFHNAEQFAALAEIVVPDRRTNGPGGPLRLASIGCASGEEAYTLAMVLHDLVPEPSGDFSVLGVNIDPTVLRKAESARYSRGALRSTPAEAKERWFRAEGNDVILAPEIRRSVRFEERNLTGPNPDLWRPGIFDVIFCRNVLMYFTPETAQAALAHMTRSLAPNGYLFLGRAETLGRAAEAYNIRHTHNTFYYQRNDPAAVHRTTSATAPAPGRAGAASVRAGQISAPASPASLPAWSRALELLQNEQYTRALHAIEAFPPPLRDWLEARLLYAVVLAHCDQVGRSEQLCRALLDADGTNARVHHQLAGCRELVGDEVGALEHYHAAAAIEPGLAMPRLRLGLLARRRGDQATAKRELRRALTLLPSADPIQLLMFGGGFDRQGLIGICQSELVASGGAP